MNRKLPSLLALRYFEAVGRNLSFTRAAAELCVTQAAVSHQIRILEEELDVKLFVRLHQRIELTPKGNQLLNVATECLTRLTDTFVQISGRDRPEQIHLTTTPLVSARWLMPQLIAFREAKKDVEIVLHHSLGLPNSQERAFDLKIFYSTQPLIETGAELLFTDNLVPVCSPKLLKFLKKEDCATMLLQAEIIHEFNFNWWVEWCRQKGLSSAIVERGIVLDDPAVLENAALVGHGVILGSTLFLHEQLKTGLLVLPFGSAPSITIYYYLRSKFDQARQPGAAAFRTWLLRLAGQVINSRVGPGNLPPSRSQNRT